VDVLAVYIRMCIGIAYPCGVAMRVIEGLKSVDTLVAGRATTLKHLNAFILTISDPIGLLNLLVNPS
jgi:hypothetical protein